jgi:transposase
MNSYSKEFRREVLAAGDAGGGTGAVALRFDVSESWVRRIKQERREQGKLAPKSTRDRRKTWEPYAAWILSQLDQRPRRRFFTREAAYVAYSRGIGGGDFAPGRACRCPAFRRA